MLSIMNNTSRTDSAQGGYPNEVASSDSDATCMLLAVMVQSQAVTQSGAMTDVNINAEKLQELKKQLADSIQQAQDAAKHSGFWGFIGNVLGSDVAKIAGAVAGIAAVIATGGAAAPLVIATLSLALQAGAKVGAELGLDPKICAGMSIAGACVGLCSGTGSAQSINTLTQVMHYVEVGANVTAATASGAGAACQYRGDLYHADEMIFQANSTGFRADQTATNMSLDDAFALLDESLHIEGREIDGATASLQDAADTRTTIVDRI